MRTMLKVLRQEAIWVALNIAGVVYYVVQAWDYRNNGEPWVDPDPVGLGDWPIWGVFLLNVIWIVALLTVLRRRRTPRSFLVVLAMGVLWIGSFCFIRDRIISAEEDFGPIYPAPRVGQPSSVDAGDLATPAPPAK